MDIPMNYLVSSGIRMEDSNKFKDSFFKDIYRQALNSIALIIRTNSQKDFSVNTSSYFDKGILPIYDVQNTIAFTGRRGTGKTSAMISVRNCLLDSNKKFQEICDEKTSAELENVQFISLPEMIDASHLDVKEDLLEVIIASMLKELCRISSDKNFNERKYGQTVEELRRKLTKLQNDYDSLIQTNGHTIPVSYNMLIQGADKHHIQSEFKIIIDDYLEVLSNYTAIEEKEKKTTRYFVICIDDIDMYPGDPMLIMQCIYRYFTLPNVIVMTSWNYNMLYQYIYKHYYRRMILDNKEEDKGHSRREQLCNEQSNDYLRKIIPFDKRIVMPSWRKSDYKDLIDKNISLYSDSKEEFEKFKDYFPRLYPGRLYDTLKERVNEGEKSISVKEFIFFLLADRTGVYLDSSGYKTHFMEPDGLRSTFELFDSLYNMNNIRLGYGIFNRYAEKNNKEKIKQNYKDLLDTFYFKILPGLNLNDQELFFFNSICREKLSRRSKAIIDYYYTLINRKIKENNSISDNSFFKYENTIEDYCLNREEYAINQDYSIGELFRILHHSTRLGIFSKELVKAILASYSFILPYYFDEGTFKYYDYLENHSFNYDIIFKGEKFDTLFGIFGGSLLGNWVYELFGFKQLHIRFKIDDLKKFKSKVTEENKKNALYAFINILMFIRIERLEELEELNVVRSKKGYYELNTEVDPTAFFINVIRFDEFQKQIRRLTGEDCEKLYNVLTELKKNLFDFLINYDDVLKEENPKRYPNFVLPLHQVDMVYNVIKRSVKEIMYISDSELRIKSYQKNGESQDENDRVLELYQKIIKYLSENKRCYPVYRDNKNKNRIVERFFKLGEKANLWEKEKICDEDSDDYRVYGEYRIKSKFEYLEFFTTEMPSKNNIPSQESDDNNNNQLANWIEENLK